MIRYLQSKDLSLGEAKQAILFPRVTDTRIVTSGQSHPDNCCAFCPINLGVGQSGTASNGIELQFTISSHRSGFEYDIVRTRRNVFWERVGRTWRRLQYQPMGTRDDHNDNDECLQPREGKIFAVDTPGFPNVALPAPSWGKFRLLNRVTTSPSARDLVQIMSFAEWVIARNRQAEIPWRRIGPLTYWHSILWLTRNADNQWVLHRKRSRIASGAFSAVRMNSPPW